MQPRDLVNGYSFNTLLNNENGFDTSIAVVASTTQGTRLVGARNSATLNNKGIQVCQVSPVPALICFLTENQGCDPHTFAACLLASRVSDVECQQPPGHSLR